MKLRPVDAAAFVLGATIAMVMATVQNGWPWPVAMVLTFLCPAFLVVLALLGMILPMGWETPGFWLIFLASIAVTNGLFFGSASYLIQMAAKGKRAALLPVVLGVGLWTAVGLRPVLHAPGDVPFIAPRSLVRTAGQIAALLIALATLSAREVSAKLPVPSLRLALGFGVDTTGSPAHEVFDLWRRYLSESSDSARVGLWSQAERAAWQPFDLVAPYVYQGFSDYTVVRLAPAVSLPNTYLITTLVSSVDKSTQAVRPLALYRVYATIEGGRWVLANALPRMTRTWRRETIGAITFVFPSTHTFDPRRARATAAFVDSLATAFGQGAPQPITYYFTTDLEETLRALGLEFFPLGADTIGGRSNSLVRHVYVGASVNGEGYLHELAHVVLAPETRGGTAPLLAEGLMTWTGGSAGRTYAELLPDLALYIADHPALSLEALMENPPARIGTLDVGYVGLAVLCDLVHRSRGLAGLRAILKAGMTPAEVLDITAHQLGISRDSLNSLWRDTVLKHRRQP